MDKREKIIKIRATDDEYSALMERSPKPRLAEWMREYCLGAKFPRANQVPNVDPALLRQLSGMGNNLNQIARALHSQDWKPVDRVQIIAALSSLQRELNLMRMENAKDDS
ncbi:MobC family plasmid mobilization relaxosome protein [Vibrio lentus]|uniref:MobC family plasmid mobilization relaxosome protein n=1 Tax=Vibrio TaxID=662 RepID=UPI0009757A9A|nr:MULTISPECIES: MobC family plasmid mobilization relaxosome protein [Vibrio]MCC4819696.1 MobC family plasmid mobilization relaxosome protein [Vibrio lentus]OMO38366.1 mobilization protein [Vibrio sp. 10N.261.45.E1]PMJ23953.1 mobilization protein [Vibrio sp. 10N.286.45.B6]PML88290.1 mobilization protein [Vibrio sp. 10N.261.49.E11]PMM20268.1 mobilization protein [Vibrio lentus]